MPSLRNSPERRSASKTPKRTVPESATGTDILPPAGKSLPQNFLYSNSLPQLTAAQSIPSHLAGLSLHPKSIYKAPPRHGHKTPEQSCWLAQRGTDSLQAGGANVKS